MSGLLFLMLHPKMTSVAPLPLQKCSCGSVTPSQTDYTAVAVGGDLLAMLQDGDLETALASGVVMFPSLASSRYYNWAVAAPMVLSLQAFQRNIPEVSGTIHLLAMLLSRA